MKNLAGRLPQTTFPIVSREVACKVYISKAGRRVGSKLIGLDETAELSVGESFLIKAGTTYNYRAGIDGLKFIRFMNNLWEE